jgi:hypothetical protein
VFDDHRTTIVIFDVIILHGISTNKLTYTDRVSAAQLMLKRLVTIECFDEVNSVRHKNIVCSVGENPPVSPYGFMSSDRPKSRYQLPLSLPEIIATNKYYQLVCKKLFPVSSVPFLADDDYDLPNDGHIYTSVCGPLEVYKWKPPHTITIDFLIRVHDERSNNPYFNLKHPYACLDPMVNTNVCVKHSMNLQHKGKMCCVGFMYSTCAITEKIYECWWEQKERRWIIQNERTDKTYPNSHTTATHTLINIEECLVRTDLIC